MHGGDLGAARQRYPFAPEPWIDLSTGINPEPYPVAAISPECWHRLPSAEDEAALVAAAAARFGVGDGACLVPAPGTQALIQLLPRLVQPSRVAVLGPTYQEHAVCWARAGHDARSIAALSAAGDARIVVLVNPDNPTGRLVPTADLRGLARALAGRDGLLVVDEAFADVLPRSASLAADLPPATVVLRSVGKAWGLAGLRLGFAVSSPAFAARLRAELGPWAVSGPALAIGSRALADGAWLAATIARLEEHTGRLDGLLAASGFEILGGTPLFRLARHEDAASIADRLGRHAILVRRFPAEPCWLRFGIPGDPAAWDRLARVLT